MAASLSHRLASQSPVRPWSPCSQGFGSSQFNSFGRPAWSCTRKQTPPDNQREHSGYEASSSQSGPLTGWRVFDNTYTVGSESLWGSSIALPGSEVEPALTKSEKILRKQISALQIQLRVVQSERDEAMTASRRTAAENQVLRERIKEDQQKLGRLERDLSFCDNTDKKQLWSAVCTAKRRLIPLQDKVTSAESRVNAAQRQLTQQRAEFQALQYESEMVAFLLVCVLFRMHSH